jgi:hypothetical protein
MSEADKAAWAIHFERFQRAAADGTVILVGRCACPVAGQKARMRPPADR